MLAPQRRSVDRARRSYSSPSGLRPESVCGADWLSRGTRKQQRDIEKAVHRLEQRLGRAPHESEIAVEMGLSLDDYQEMITEVGSSAAFGPTLEMGFSIVQDIWRLLPPTSEKAFYQREVGPYTWQQDGGSKFMAHLAKMVGVT